MQALQAAQQSLLGKLRTPMRELLDHSNQAAGAYRLNGQYHGATQTLESAATAIHAESNKFPDDKGFNELWLEAVGDAAAARSREGAVAPAGVSLALLEQSANDYQSLAGKYAALGDRQEEAAAEGRSRYCFRRSGRARQRRQVRCPVRSGCAGVSQRARGAH
ncbi:MAG: hypothetical protein WDM87_13745 [Terracidiphilus sp.]